MAQTRADTVIDLGEVARRCRAVTAWYDALCAGREPSLKLLDDALAELRSMPPLGGRFGRAIRVIVSGGAADRDATVDALEVLRSLAPTVRNVQPTAPPARRRRRPCYDTPLPGLDAAYPIVTYVDLRPAPRPA